MSIKSDSSLLQTLSKEIQTVNLDDLVDHVKREAVFLVDDQLELAVVAFSIATDKKLIVEKWLSDKEIIKVESQKLDEMKKSNKEYNILIIQPYVLVQKSLSL